MDTPNFSTISLTGKQKFMLFYIYYEVTYDSYRLVKTFDQLDFPSDSSVNLAPLLFHNLIYIPEKNVYNTKYCSTIKGNYYVQQKEFLADIMAYFNSVNPSEHYIELTKILVEKYIKENT